jgi:hypothetical protein
MQQALETNGAAGTIRTPVVTGHLIARNRSARPG